MISEQELDMLWYIIIIIVGARNICRNNNMIIITLLLGSRGHFSQIGQNGVGPLYSEHPLLLFILL